MREPSYVREARLAQQRYERRIPVQLEIGEPMDEERPHILITGNPVDGFTYIGPFTREEAVQAIDDFDDECWVTELESFEGALNAK